MTESNQEQQNRGGSKIAGFIKGLFRLILILILIAVIGIALYFGGKMLYEQAVIPIAENRTEINQLNASQKSAQEQVDKRLLDFNQRLADLENQKVIDAEKIAELSSDISHLEKTIEEHDVTLKQIDELEQSIQSVEDNLASELAGIALLEEALTAEDSPIVTLQQEVALLKAMELLSRSRLYMLQNNYGLAREDIQNARNVLDLLLEQLPSEKVSITQNWINRLDQALANLPDYPVAAADDLEIAWRSLAKGFSGDAEQYPEMIFKREADVTNSTPSYTPAVTSTITPTVVPDLTATATPAP